MELRRESIGNDRNLKIVLKEVHMKKKRGSEQKYLLQFWD